jgi:hypothetical protein
MPYLVARHKPASQPFFIPQTSIRWDSNVSVSILQSHFGLEILFFKAHNGFMHIRSRKTRKAAKRRVAEYLNDVEKNQLAIRAVVAKKNIGWMSSRTRSASLSRRLAGSWLISLLLPGVVIPVKPATKHFLK